ncbi:MAG: hypothetical protein ACOYID_04785 [Eubacteriales bacterium]|jgi:protein-S-isoprenylcysteine O-methyltransferase Ste14
MPFIAVGAFSYVLFLIYDINSVKANLPALRLLFGLGTVLLGCSSVAVAFLSRGFAHAATPVFAAVAAAFLALTIYSLFFALPPKSTYIDGQPKLCATGMYALCRHPGVLWLTLMYATVFGALPCTLTLVGGLIFSALDVLYALFQDVWTFPRIFPEYGEYKRSVPFLLPSPASVRLAVSGRAAVPCDNDKNG